MLQEAKNLQKDAINKLVSLLKNSKQKSLVFKAPTGSGKTYMIADFMNRILAEDKDVVFLVSSLSKGNLAQQNHEKFEEYKNTFTHLNPYLINSEISSEEQLFIPTEYNVYSLPLSLYKKGGRLMQGSLTNFFEAITGGRLLGGSEKKIVLIKDECHIATNNLDDIPKGFINKIIDVSATPKLERGQYPDVEITNADAEQAKLIKNVEWGDDHAKLEDALNKFQEIKEEYRNQLYVNPCLIIQISNKDKANEELVNEIFPALDKTDLKWILIVNDPKKCDSNDLMKAKKLPVDKWKKYAKDSTASIDVIIFKLTISEGWDIPRACMLYQMRDSHSKQLDEQVMGRVRRNPCLTNYEGLSEEAQKLATTAWVWGIQPEGMAKVYSVRLQGDKNEVKNNISIKTTRLKLPSERKDFSISTFLKDRDEPTHRKSIFELWRALEHADNDVQGLVGEYATDYTKWFLAAENVEDIARENNQYQVDYTSSMEVSPEEVTFASDSFYSDNGNHQNISNWVWKRRDGAIKFAFDSEAERDWAEILKDLSSDKAISKATVGEDGQTGFIEGDKISGKEIMLWGKNYVGNSEIKFEYYLGARHSSYPDFVMKDAYGRIHIFEVKSMNISKSMPAGFDESIYKAKVKEIKKAYKQASALTDQVFYLPITKDDLWEITQFDSGSENTLTLEQFQTYVASTGRQSE